MSYVRFGSDGSDVYVFTSSEGIECCGCGLQQREWEDNDDSPFGGWFRPVGEIVPHVFTSNAEMIEHLETHQAKGDHVPEYVFERLRDPADEAANKAVWAERANG